MQKPNFGRQASGPLRNAQVPTYRLLTCFTSAAVHYTVCLPDSSYFFLGCTFLHLDKRREEEKKGKVERFTQAPLSKNSHLNVRLKRSAATHLVPFRPSAFLSGDNTQHIGTGDEINFCVYPSLFFPRYLLRRSRHRHQTAEHQGSDFATLAGELGHETIKSKTLASWTKA